MPLPCSAKNAPIKYWCKLKADYLGYSNWYYQQKPYYFYQYQLHLDLRYSKNINMNDNIQNSGVDETNLIIGIWSSPLNMNKSLGINFKPIWDKIIFSCWHWIFIHSKKIVLVISIKIGWKSSPGKVWTIFPLLPLTWTFSICLFSLIPYRLLGTRLKMWLLSWNVRAICLILKLIQNTRKSQGIRLRLKLGIYLSIDSKLKIETRCKSYCWIICQMLRSGLRIMDFWLFLEKISNSSPV